MYACLFFNLLLRLLEKTCTCSELIICIIILSYTAIFCLDLKCDGRVPKLIAYCKSVS